MPRLDDILDAERKILGCAILDPTTVDQTEGQLQRKDWIGEGHAAAWSLICDLRHSGGPLSDVKSVVRLLRQANILDALGGIAGVAEWCDAVPGNLPWYVSVVQDASQQRRLQDLARQLDQRCASESPADTVRWLEAQLDGVRKSNSLKLETLGEAAREAVDQVRKARERGRAGGCDTGIGDLDAGIGGLFGGDLAILAARTNVGKTALGTQIAVHVAKTIGPVLVVSLEMQSRDIAARLISKLTKISVAEMRAASVNDYELEQMEAAASELAEVPLSLFYSRNATAAKIRSACRIRQATGGLAMVVVDYLQIVKADDTRRPRHEQISQISGDLKSLGMELDVPVLALSQLNRIADKETPRLSHLRDSGSIEQDADMVLLLNRENRGSRDATVEVAKNRHGPKGDVKLRFDPDLIEFLDREAKDMPNYENEFDEYATPF